MRKVKAPQETVDPLIPCSCIGIEGDLIKQQFLFKRHNVSAVAFLISDHGVQTDVSFILKTYHLVAAEIIS